MQLKFASYVCMSDNEPRVAAFPWCHISVALQLALVINTN